jgi:hypothetical protein
VNDKKLIVALDDADSNYKSDKFPLLKLAATNDEEIGLQLKGPNHSIATFLIIISSVGVCSSSLAS